MKTLSPFVATPIEVVRKMLELAEVKPNELVVDLGAGDGRIVIMAAKNFGARGIGVEIDESLVRLAREKVVKNHLEDRVEIVLGDLFRVDLREADVVTLFLSASDNEMLRPKFEEQLKPGARVVSHNFIIYGWEPVRVELFEGRRLYLYVKGGKGHHKS